MPYVSNLTGTWITPEQATDPQYWVDHLRHTVRFADCLATVLADGPMVLAELGPGHALSSFARRADGEPAAVIAGLRHPNQVVDDTAFSLLSFARLWAAGVDVDLERFAGTGRRRLRLPDVPVPARALLDRARCRLHRHHTDRRHRRTAQSHRPPRRNGRAASTISTTCSGSPRGSRATRRALPIARAPGSWSATKTTRSSASLVDELVARGAHASAAPAMRPRASTTRSTAS